MQDHFGRYLRLLGIRGSVQGLDGLRLLVRSHLLAVPFENVSKLLLADREAGRGTTLTEFLDGIEFSDLGGTCYSCNPFLTELLRVLGYHADLLGADMSQPNVHTCIRVQIDEFSYHVDVGFAAPFREPMRLDQLPVSVDEGNNHYVLAGSVDPHRLHLKMTANGEEGVGYVVTDTPRNKDFFNPALRDSYCPGAHFMNCLRVSRVFENHSVDLIDRKLYRHQSGDTTFTHLATPGELRTAIHDQFHMPRCPIESAVSILERRTGRSFFDDSATVDGRPPFPLE